MEYMDIETVKELDHVFGDIEELQKFRCLMMQYECAMLEVKTKLDVLNTELSVQNSYRFCIPRFCCSDYYCIHSKYLLKL